MTNNICSYCTGFITNNPNLVEQVDNYISLCVADEEGNFRQLCVFCHVKLFSYENLTPAKLDFLLDKKA